MAGLLKQLSVFHKKDGNLVYTVRIAQGLLHMGKGLLTINPCVVHGAWPPSAF